MPYLNNGMAFLGSNGETRNAKGYEGSMSQNLKGRLPYNYNVVDTAESKNTKYKYFQKVGMRRPEALSKNSVSLNNDYNNTPFASIERDKSFSDVMYATANDDKPIRMRDYRMMASFSEVADALDEICDETINPDENDDVVILKFKNTDLESDVKNALQKEWSKYIEHYDLHNNGWQYFRQYLIEGELFFEQIIHEEYTNQGILGVINIPSDVIDPVYGNIQNMMIKGFLYQKPIFNSKDPKKIEKYEPIPYEENQVVYISSGAFNDTKDFVIPFLENCRRAQQQLRMMEDAIVIHQMVHAPLRFVFNVDVGRLPAPAAESYLRQLQQKYWSTKTFDVDQNDIVKKYSPQSTLDSYWFSKRQGQDPTTVTEIGGQTNTNGMENLLYYIKKLYRSLKVPASRLDPEDSFRDGTDILREELKFSVMVKRHQKKFASGLKRGFITHLKLRQMFEENDLTEQNISIVFNEPSNFAETRNNQKIEMKMATFGNAMGTGKISESFAMKKYLNMSDVEILANRALRESDACAEWSVQNALANGPQWKKMIIDQANAGQPVDGGEMPSGGGIGGGSDIPPDFGGLSSGDEPEAPPNAGNEPTPPSVPEELPA
jgi:Bacteriophage T4-like portal protein (Gp20)